MYFSPCIDFQQKHSTLMLYIHVITFVHVHMKACTCTDIKGLVKQLYICHTYCAIKELPHMQQNRSSTEK